MNIKINQAQASYLFKLEEERVLIGSRLYGTNRPDSDTDVLVMCEELDDELSHAYACNHQFQYDCLGDNTQYIFTTEAQFWRNLMSGDSTINADVILFSDLSKDELTDEERLNICRTYNVIKAYLGFAKRDIRDLKSGKRTKNKQHHIERGLYCADCLLDNKLPVLDIVKNLLCIGSVEYLEVREKYLREKCNKMFDSGELTMYPKNPILELGDSMEDQLLKLQFDSMNTKEFRYV